MTPHTAESRARWAISAMFFVNGAALGAWAPQIPVVQERLSLSHGVLGNALLASAVGIVLTMPFGGALIHRFGSRVTSLVGGIAQAVIMPVLAAATSFWMLAATLFVMGVCNGQLDVGMNSHSLAVQSRFKRPILSAIHGWWSLGGVWGGMAAGWAAGYGIGPVQFMVANSILLLAVLAFGWAWMLPASADRGHEDGAPLIALPRGPLLPLGALVLMSFISESGVWDWGAVYLRRHFGTSEQMAAFGFGFFSLGMATARFLGDNLIHRFGAPRVLCYSGLLAAAGLLSALALGSAGWAMVGFFFVGLGVANLVPILFTAAGTQPGIPAGVGLAAVTTCGYFGFLAGPPAIGHLAEAYSLPFAMGLVALFCASVGLLGPRFVRRRT